MTTMLGISLAGRTVVMVGGGAVTPRRVRADDVAAAWLVHTATGDHRVDGDVAAECERRRILCVNASDGAHGSARLAAETRSGDVIVGVVSDAGVDPGRAARLRDAVADLLR